MSTSGEGPLTQLARSIQTDNHQFQQELTGAAGQAASDPAAALIRFNQCWAQTDNLEQREISFLGQMGDLGAQQVAVAKDSWRENRLQILAGKAQVLFLLGRYDEAQSAIDAARRYISGPAHPGATLLDQLEMAIIQAKA